MIIKRKCKICEHIEEYESGSSCFEVYMYKVTFREEIKKIQDLEEYKELKAGNYNGSFLCGGCTSDLFMECPEVIKEIRMVIPNV